MRHCRSALALAIGLLALHATGAVGEVHFGRNVFIGGHNFSHQSYHAHHRLRVMLYDRPIAAPAA